MIQPIIANDKKPIEVPSLPFRNMDTKIRAINAIHSPIVDTKYPVIICGPFNIL